MQKVALVITIQTGLVDRIETSPDSSSSKSCGTQWKACPLAFQENEMEKYGYFTHCEKKYLIFNNRPPKGEKRSILNKTNRVF